MERDLRTNLKEYILMISRNDASYRRMELHNEIAQKLGLEKNDTKLYNILSRLDEEIGLPLGLQDMASEDMAEALRILDICVEKLHNLLKKEFSGVKK
jgi:alcohol dehydrogenase class IV